MTLTKLDCINCGEPAFALCLEQHDIAIDKTTDEAFALFTREQLEALYQDLREELLY